MGLTGALTREGGGRCLGIGLIAACFLTGLYSAWLPAFDGTNDILAAQSPAPTELSPDEQATIAVFERATRSVVFIANTSM